MSRERYQQIDSRECQQCTDGFFSVDHPFAHDDYADKRVLLRLSDEQQTTLINAYGSLDTVPRAYNLPPEMRVHRMSYACLCEKGRLKQSALGLRSVSEVLQEQDIKHLWPNGVESGMPIGERVMSEAGVPDACLRWTITSFEARMGDTREGKRYVKYAQAWAQEPVRERSDVVLFGPNGTGKTGLAIAMLRAAVEQHQSVLFVPLKQLAMRWTDTYRSDADSSGSDLLAQLVAPDVVCFDEVTGTRLSEFVEDTLTMIVDMRQKALRASLLTLNVPADALADDVALTKTLGPTLFDRLRERGQFWPLMGDSKRQTFAARR